MASSVSYPRWPWRFWEASASVLMLLWLHPKRQVKKVLQQPWDSCCSVDCLFYPGGSCTPGSSKAIKCLWAFAPQLFWICLSPGKVEILAFTFFRETGKNEGYRGWRSILLFWRLQKHEIASQLHGSTSIYVTCWFDHISWKISRLTAIPIILHTPGTVGPSFDLLMFSYVEDILQPVPWCCLWKSGMGLNCFLWDPSLLIRTLVALIRTGCKHGWLKDHFVNGLSKMNSHHSRKPSWFAKGSQHTKSEGHWWSLLYLHYFGNTSCL